MTQESESCEQHQPKKKKKHPNKNPPTKEGRVTGNTIYSLKKINYPTNNVPPEKAAKKGKFKPTKKKEIWMSWRKGREFLQWSAMKL